MKTKIFTSLAEALGAAVSLADSEGLFFGHNRLTNWKARKAQVRQARNSRRKHRRPCRWYRPLGVAESVPKNAQVLRTLWSGHAEWVSVRRFPKLIGSRLSSGRSLVRVLTQT